MPLCTGQFSVPPISSPHAEGDGFVAFPKHRFRLFTSGHTVYWVRLAGASANIAAWIWISKNNSQEACPVRERHTATHSSGEQESEPRMRIT